MKLSINVRNMAGSPRAAQRTGTGLLSLAALALLVACGGGSGTDQPTVKPASAKPTALYFTDDFSAEHDAVWITVSKVTVVSPSGQTDVATFEPARLINLPTLKRAGALFATAQIPADATALRVYVGTAAKLQKLDGSLLEVTLEAAGGFLEFKLEGWKADSGVLALDFDLPRFQLQGQVLKPALRVAGDTDFAQWNDRYAEVEGTVTAVSAASLSLQSSRLGARTFTLDAQTSYVSKRGADWRPAVGDRVEVYGKVSGQGGQDLQFLARTVKDDGNVAGAAAWVEVKGKVSAVNGTVATLDIDRSQAGGPVGSISVNLAGARFERGALTLVQPGVRLELHLTASGTGWTAQVVEIDGAPKKAAGSTGGSASLTEVKARVVSVAGSLVEVTPFKVEGPAGGWVSGPIRADVAGAYFERSALTCLLPGQPVELKGSFNAAGVLVVTKVEGEGACSAAAPVAGVKPSDGTSPPAAGAVFVEAKGSVTAVRSGEFDLTVFKVEGVAIAPASITVRYGSNTVFKGLDAKALNVGVFVEVKGLYAAGVLEASKIERD